MQHAGAQPSAAGAQPAAAAAIAGPVVAGPPSRAPAEVVAGVPDDFLGDWIAVEQKVIEYDGSKLPDGEFALNVRRCVYKARTGATTLLPQLLRAQYAGDVCPSFFVRVRGKKGFEKISIWRPAADGGDGANIGSFTGLDASEVQRDGTVHWVRASGDAVTGKIAATGSRCVVLDGERVSARGEWVGRCWLGPVRTGGPLGVW